MQAPISDNQQVSKAGGIPYLPGLDGLRALAVLGVLIYHADLPLRGGFLGVESFFVLSGFLITALLLADWEAFGRVRLGLFWWRRARRLLPALFALLLGVALATAILLPDDLGDLAGEALAALIYLTNWHLIVGGQPYFDPITRPSLLQHLWSLAIEEQFYILWPLLLIAGMRLLGRRALLVFSLLLALASSVLIYVLYDPGADVARLYYGTDTRASGLLIGCALALLWRPGRMPAWNNAWAGPALNSLGLLALAGLLYAYAVLGESHPLLYQGGFMLVALLTACLVVATTHPSARLLPMLLELPLLRWIGLRSYSLYLWHWPIFMLTRPGVDLAAELWQVQLLRFSLTFGLAALAYKLIEVPIRAGALERAWAALRQQHFSAVAARFTLPSDWTIRQLVRLSATIMLSLALSYIGVGMAQAAVLQSLITTPDEAQARSATPGVVGVSPERARPGLSATPTAEPAATPLAAPSPVQTPTVVRPPTVAPDVTSAALPSVETPEQHLLAPDLAAQLQAILDRMVADGFIPGAALSVALPDGSSWSGASGVADREAGLPMQPETRVLVGSLSKLFTAVVVLQLVEEGQLGLDDPIATHLPGLLPTGEQITIRMLLQHTSGLYDYLEDRRFVASAYEDPARVWQPSELVTYANQFPQRFAPGTPEAWDYSSTNYVVLGLLIEHVSGNSLAVELERRIFSPLDLKQTFSTPPDRVDGAQARGYSRSIAQPSISLSFAFGTANIVTTVSDMRRFSTALFAGELLEPATLAEMQGFVDGKGRYAMPDLAYGLGLMANQLPLGPGPDGQMRAAADGYVLGHIGGINGFRAVIWYASEHDVLLVLSVNQGSVDPNDLARPVFEALLAAAQQDAVGK